MRFLLIGSIFLLGIMNITNASNQGMLAKTLARNFSKEFCSCYFVARNTKSYCQSYASSIIKIKKIKIDYKNKVILSKVGSQVARAKFLTRREGCILERL